MAVPLEAPLADLIEGPVSIHVASRDDGNAPSVARAIGARLARDRTRVLVFLSRPQAGRLLADIERCRRVAVVFTRPSTHQSIQLKSDDAVLQPPDAADFARMRAYADAFVAEIGTIGFAAPLGRALLDVEPADVVAVAFTPGAAFQQTPGPRAGTPLPR